MSYYSDLDEAMHYFSASERALLAKCIRQKAVEVIDYVWVMRDGTRVRVADMKDSHLKNSLSMVKRTTNNAEQIKALSDEIARRKVNSENAAKPIASGIDTSKVKSTYAERICHCGNKYQAKVADLKRGWGLSCSKRCAAIRRGLGRPVATLISEA